MSHLARVAFAFTVSLMFLSSASNAIERKDKPLSLRGTVTEIDKEKGHIKVKVAVFRRGSAKVDESKIPVHTIIYDEKTQMKNGPKSNTTIDMLKVGDFIILKYNLVKESKIATIMLWGMKSPGSK